MLSEKIFQETMAKKTFKISKDDLVNITKEVLGEYLKNIEDSNNKVTNSTETCDNIPDMRWTYGSYSDPEFMRRRFEEPIVEGVNISNPNGTYEITEQDDFEKYGNDIWDILQNSYKALGGFKSYNSVVEMVNRISMAILCFHNNKIVACAIYRDDLGGQKLNGCGTIDGSETSKQLLRNVIKDDIENIRKYHWVEVSYPLEKWFKEEGGNPIPSKMAYKLLHKSKSKIRETGDGVHYEREIGRDHIPATKAIYGFNSDATYNHVMNKLEEYTGFKEYEDFKKYVNSLPSINEEIEYLDNHPDKTIALAMEIVIQIGNLWDDGVYELTPHMQEYLKNAISVLQNYPEKNSQIVALIKNGTYYLNNMDVLKCHTEEDFNYILYPIAN